jgi:hypothetical protein
VFDVDCWWETPEREDPPDLGDVPFRFVRLDAGCEVRLRLLWHFAPRSFEHSIARYP